MKTSVLIYDGDKFVMELVVVKERHHTLYAIKKEDKMAGITKRNFLRYIKEARAAGYTIAYDSTDF